MDHVLVYALRRYPAVRPPYGNRVGLFWVGGPAYRADFRYRVRAPVDERHDFTLMIIPHYIFYELLEERFLFHIFIVFDGQLARYLDYLRRDYVELRLGYPGQY